MRKSSVKKLIVAVALIVMLLAVVTSVKATEVKNPLQIITTNTTSNETTTTNTTTNTTTTNTVANVVPSTTTNQVSNYQNTNLPQTGDASDYVIFLFIAVAAVVAIYAYRKVRNYNI